VEEREHAVVEEIAAELGHLRAGRVEGGHRLAGRPVADNLETAEEPDVAVPAYRRVLDRSS
jgi:hypothetical protein